MDFKSVIEEKFRFLVTDYGFSVAVNDYGREVFFTFDRGIETVSISVEAGSNPIVEIFEPVSESGDKAVPWAEKNGVKRSRRFPKLGITTNFKEESSYIQEMATQLAKTEREWLEKAK